MKIGLDLTHCYKRQSGIQRYAINLTKALLSIDDLNEYVLFFRKEIPEELINLSVRKVISPISHQVLNEQSWLLYSGINEKLDQLFLTGFAGPLLFPYKYVSTVHDTTVFRYPETVKRNQFFYWHYVMPLSLRKAARVITDSQSSKSDITKYYKVPTHKIDTVPLAVDDCFGVVKDKSIHKQVQYKYKLPERFILLVSTLEPRKNYERLIESFAKISSLHPDVGLVFTGRSGWLYQQLFEKIQSKGLSEKVLFLGPIPDSDLVTIYNLAEFLAYPSLYEGFGLPILEAMKCGCPVLTSNVSSMPEVGGNAAYYVNPLDTEEIALALDKLLNDKELRLELIKRGFENSKKFSWKNTARQTLDIIKGC